MSEPFGILTVDPFPLLVVGDLANNLGSSTLVVRYAHLPFGSEVMQICRPDMMDFGTIKAKSAGFSTIQRFGTAVRVDCIMACHIRSESSTVALGLTSMLDYQNFLV